MLQAPRPAAPRHLERPVRRPRIRPGAARRLRGALGFGGAGRVAWQVVKLPIFMGIYGISRELWVIEW